MTETPPDALKPRAFARPAHPRRADRRRRPRRDRPRGKAAARSASNRSCATSSPGDGSPRCADFAKLQIARLESLSLLTLDRGQKGELEALDRALKILDRLDRYHGFTARTPRSSPMAMRSASGCSTSST